MWLTQFIYQSINEFLKKGELYVTGSVLKYNTKKKSLIHFNINQIVTEKQSNTKPIRSNQERID